MRGMFVVMQFLTLGPVAAVDGDRSVQLGSPRHRAVLAVLLSRVGYPVPIDVIATEIWGDDADNRSVASLYTHISNLRGVVGKKRIISEGLVAPASIPKANFVLSPKSIV